MVVVLFWWAPLLHSQWGCDWLLLILSTPNRHWLHFPRHWQWHLTDKSKWLLHGYFRFRLLTSSDREPHWPLVLNAELLFCLMRPCRQSRSCPTHRTTSQAMNSADTRHTGHGIVLQDHQIQLTDLNQPKENSNHDSPTSSQCLWWGLMQ